MLYLCGYQGGSKSLTALNGWGQFAKLHPELRRRLLALFDASGGTVGIGGGWRSSATQDATFRARHVIDDAGGGIFYAGHRWTLKPDSAPAAAPGNSYHESTTSDGYALAADLIGDLRYVHANCGRFGLVEFGEINGEPWHVQPVEIPHTRRQYTGQTLKTWTLPGVPAPTQGLGELAIPTPPLRVGSSGEVVKLLQRHLAGWGLYTSTIDGRFGPKTELALKALQSTLRVMPDGQYGPRTAAALAAFRALVRPAA